MLSWPTHVLEQNSKLPKNGTYYVVARNGTFIRKDMPLIEALVPTTISSLEIAVPYAGSKMPKIPTALLIRSLLFFRVVYKRHRAEAIVLLHYSERQKKYMLWCPNQKVAGLRIASYDPHERFKDFQLVGTIHSHASVSAGHSSTDHNDEKNFDGLHITLGDVEQLHAFSLSASLMVNGHRFVKEPSELIRGVSMLGGQKYDFILPKGKDCRHIQFPRNWLKKVKGESRADQNHRLGRNRLLPDRQTAPVSGLFGERR